MLQGAMSYLIDGYNLLFALGLPPGQVGPTGLQKARRRLLDLLRAAHGAEASAVTVVFDAAGAPPGAAEVQEYQGLQVRFAIRQPEADDLIELLIRKDSTPRQLTVVSDDHRIQTAAQRRQCVVLGCGDYLDWLEQQRRAKRPPARQTPTKPAASSAEDTQHWLREFADLEHNPEWKDLFEPFDFGDVEGEEGA
jgi:predicted RNA-binding protein with PIN domain